MKILLHCCCAPCAAFCIDSLKNDGHEVDLFFFNPNIHPFTEYKARRDTLKTYAEKNGLKFIEPEGYDLKSFLNTLPNFENRCETCYCLRLKKTADYTAEHGYDAFSTTLLISPYQNHDLITKCGQDTATLSKFLYRDFRPLFRDGQKFARENGFYMQKYCGCIFSEEERYK